MISMFFKIAGLFFLLLLSSCHKEDRPYQPSFSSQSLDGARKTYNFGVMPLHNPKLMLERYRPILAYLNSNIEGVNFTFETARNYEEFEKKLYGADYAFALANPYHVVQAVQHGYHVFGKMGDDDYFRGLLLVRRDSGIHEIADLKGKKVSYTAKNALAATMMPQYYLQTRGLDVNQDIENLYVGSQESSIMNLYLGNVSAAAASVRPWLTYQRDYPDKAAQLEVKWTTESLIHNGLLARADMPPELVQQVARLLASLHESDEGRAMLEKVMISRFELADDRRYDVVQQFLDKFSHAVRPLALQ